MAAIAHVLHVVKDADAAARSTAVGTLVARLQTYQHSIVALSGSRAADVAGVPVHLICPGVSGVWSFWRLLRRLRPHVLHTSTPGALPLHALATLCGTVARVHAEHEASPNAEHEDGRDLVGVQRWERFVHHFVAASRKIEKQLVQAGIEPGRVSQIYQGVECATVPARGHAQNSHLSDGAFVVAAIEDGSELTTLQAWLRLLREAPVHKQRARLTLSLPEPMQPQALSFIQQHQLMHSVTLCARQEDLWQALPGAQLFVSHCRHRGNAAVLQAMVNRLPVIALDMEGETELLVPGQTGELVAVADPAALSKALQGFLRQPQKAHAQGRAARLRAVQLFSIDGMVNRYAALYQMLLRRGGVSPEISSVHG